MKKKKLPSKHIIPVDISIDDDLMLGALNIYLLTDYKFQPEELKFFCGLCEKNKSRLNEGMKSFYSLNCLADGKLKTNYRLDFLKLKFHNGLTEQEFDELFELLGQEIQSDVELTIKTVKSSGENNIQKIYKEHREEIKRLIRECRQFKVGTLLTGDKPIYWNKDRMLHIMSRHIQETFIEYFNKNSKQPKTIIPYSISDLEKLIQNVLEVVENEIQSFFRSKPHSIYRNNQIIYNGDTYSIMISKDGLLMMFTKRGLSNDI